MSKKDSRIARVFAGALCAALCWAPAALATPASTTTVYRSATAGIAAPSPAVAAAPLLSSSPAPGAHPRGARRTRRGQTSSPLAPAVAGPQLAASPLAQAPGSLLANFNGVSSRDSEVTNFGLEFEPPDQGLCVGNGYVLEMVNSAYTVYSTAGKALAGPYNVNGPYGEGLTEFTSDPRCYYDAATHTWFATILAINRENTGSTLDIAVNSSGDPRTVWTDYKINTTDLGGASGPRHKGCPCFGDQPTLGIDANNLYVTTNEFAINSERFNGAQVYAFAKKDLVALSPAVHYVHFDDLSIGGALAASIQPAITTGTPAAEYFLDSLDPTETFDDRVGVWALSDAAAVAAGGVPTLTSTVIASEAYGVPPQGEQRGASSLIESGDDRMQQTQYIDGSIWGELSTSLTIPGDPTPRAAAAWFQVTPRLSQGEIASAKIARQGYVSMTGNYVLYPALQVTPAGSAAMVLTLTGAKRYPSAAYAVLAPGAASFGAIAVAAPGTTYYDPEAERWGDYSWAILDPSGSSVWLATEYVPPKSSQTTDGKHDWGTRVFDLAPEG